jgi:hypothetical protein
MNLRRIAGAALAETAIVLSFTLMCIFGAVQIAIVGFVQTQLDGATFMYSHAWALGSQNSATLDTALAPIFPSLPLTSWTSSDVINAHPLNTDTTTMPNWTKWGSLTQRFGGAAILRDRLVQTKGTASIHGLTALGDPINLSAGNVEGQTMVGNHDDDAQGAGYNSSTIWNSLVNPITQDDQNVPPYYFDIAFMNYCTHAQFQAGSCQAVGASGGQLRSLGLAEFLKDDPSGNEDDYDTPNNGIGTGGTFATMACHQRIFANLAAAFPATMPSPSPIAGSDYDETSAGPSSVAAWGGASFQEVYAWDVQGVHGTSPSNKLFGYQYPLSAEKGC